DGDRADYDACIGALQGMKAAHDDGSKMPLRVMTLHRAKGLELETVILPALDRTTAGTEARLLRWRVRPGGLLLARAKPRGSDDPIYDYLGALAADESAAELARVLYVGCTRATT